MGEEIDYMSDECLKSCLSSVIDERPGIIKSRKEQREHELMKNKSLVNKARDAVKDDYWVKLDENLSKPLTSENKGFLMIQKMGFKPGMGLGKQNTGISDPIQVNLKNDRRGLGLESCCQTEIRKKRMEREKIENLTNIEDYVEKISKKHRDRESASDLRKSQRICHQLDLQSDIEKPKEIWFWPVDSMNYEEEKDKDINLELSEKLEILTKYLRNTYFYCIWCGVQYADEKDLQDCPGPERGLH